MQLIAAAGRVGDRLKRAESEDHRGLFAAVAIRNFRSLHCREENLRLVV